MNFQLVHAVLVILGLLATALPQLESAFPSIAPTLKIAASVCAALTMVLGALSPSVASKGKPGGGTGAKITMACLSVALLLGASGCSWFGSNAAPFLPTPEQGQCIAVDVQKSMPALSIVTDCGLTENAVAFIENLIAQEKAVKRYAVEHDAGVEAGIK